jgi:hypothetical protein
MAIEKSYAKRVFEIGDHVRYRGLGDSELHGGFGHAALLDHHVEHMQVPQPKARSDLVFPNS